MHILKSMSRLSFRVKVRAKFMVGVEFVLRVKCTHCSVVAYSFWKQHQKRQVTQKIIINIPIPIKLQSVYLFSNLVSFCLRVETMFMFHNWLFGS